MKFKLNISIDNAAFEVMPEREVAAILLKVGSDLVHGMVEGKCQDVNGNTVGQYEFTED